MLTTCRLPDWLGGHAIVVVEWLSEIEVRAYFAHPEGKARVAVLIDPLDLVQVLAPPSTVDTPGDGPIPFPGEAVARRLPGGGWVEARSATKVPTPEYDGPQCWCESPEGGWYCTGHLAGWHVASTGTWGRVGAVWPIGRTQTVQLMERKTHA